MRTVVAYISAHGFGHWAQMAPVLQALHDGTNDIRIVLRTGLSCAVLQERSTYPFELVSGQVDVGVIQCDAINEDIPATIAAVEQFHHHWDERVGKESSFLREAGADLVLSDIAPLAFAAAAIAGVPSIGLASIDWHAIYTPLFPQGHASLEQIAAAHQACALLLALPLGMPLTSFPRQRKIGLIARKSELPRRELRRRLGFTDADKVALILFGGSSVPPFCVKALAGMAGWRFIMPSMPAADVPANVQAMPEGADMSDLIKAADVIVCKPGYGVISEAWRAARPLVYVPRPAFPEYPFLQDWLSVNAPSCELELSDFVAGDWAKALEATASSSQAYPPCAAGGEIEAAGIIWAALAGEDLITSEGTIVSLTG